MLPLMDSKAVTVVFANIEDILLTNTVMQYVSALLSKTNHFLQTFMSSLEERQKECRLYVDRIGDILQAHIPNMRVYMVKPESLEY